MGPHEKRQKLLFRFACATVCVSLFLTLAIDAWQLYVRWAVNQNFTVLGGNELEALTLSAFALLIALLVVYRPHGH